MVLDYNQIITNIAYLFGIYLAIWIVAKTRLWSKIFAGLYFIAILPNLVALLSGFSIDSLIMAFFDSIYLYILLPLYFCVLLIIRLGEQGWLGLWLTKKTSSSEDRPEPSVEEFTPREGQVELTLKKLIRQLEKE